jgi:hypothetical protein
MFSIFSLWTFHIIYMYISSKVSRSPPWLCWPFWNILCHKWRRICSICRERFPVLSSFMTYICIIGFVTRLTWWVPLVDQERLALPEYLTSLPVFSGVRVTRSLVLCVCFVDRCLSIVLLLFTDSAYPFGIFKLFLTYSTI